MATSSISRIVRINRQDDAEALAGALEVSEQATVAGEVLGFIKHFAKAKDCFTDGCCYWFGYILQARFGARLFYVYCE